MGTKHLLPSLAAGALLLSTTVFAQERSPQELQELREKLEQQSRTISELMNRVNSLEAEKDAWMERGGAPVALTRELDALRTELSAVAEKEEEKKPSWTDWIKFKGDFRFRYEVIDDRTKDYDRHRNRVRARLGMVASPFDVLDIIMEITSGESEDDFGGDHKSNNQTLTNHWTFKNAWFSQMYFDWHPSEDVPGLHIQGGKVKRPFITPAKHELIYDSDVNPEGGVVKYHTEVDNIAFDVQGYAFWLQENKDTADQALFGGQAAVTLEIDEGLEAQGIVGYYDFTNTDGTAPLFGDSFGNSLDPTGTFYTKDYDILEFFGEVRFEVEDMPLAVQGGFVKNTATGSDDKAWQAGFTVNKAKARGTWDARYLWRTVQADAIYAVFADSDFGGGDSSVKGHEFNFKYMIEKNWSLAFSFFYNWTDIRGADDRFLRYQLDMAWKF